MKVMTSFTITLPEQTAEAWHERARRMGYASTDEAMIDWVASAIDDEGPVDPAEVEILRERLAADPATFIPFDEGIARIAAKHGLTLRKRDGSK